MAFSRGMNGIVATTCRDKRRVNDRPWDGILCVVIASSEATMTPNGVSTAGHAGSHAWGDCVRHRSLRATMQRSLNQESHGLSRVECQLCAERLMCGRSRCVDPSSRRGSPDARRPARHPPGGPRGPGRRPVASLAIVILLALSSVPTDPVGLSAPVTPPLYSRAATRAARPARCAHGGRRPTAVLYRSFVVRCAVAKP